MKKLNKIEGNKEETNVIAVFNTLKNGVADPTDLDKYALERRNKKSEKSKK